MPHRSSLLFACVAVLAVAGATVIDGTGQFVVPGFFDTNVHLSLYGGVNDRYETLVRYHSRQAEIVLEAAQLQLKHGVTTVRDSYGVLPALVETRERIAKGQAVGARILAAGNIVGWGGPYSVPFSLIREAGLTLFQEQRRTSAARRRKRTPRPPMGCGWPVAAGIDGIQHPEVLGPRELSAALIREIVAKQIACNMLVNTITGEAWTKHVKDRTEAQKKLGEAAAAELGMTSMQAIVAGTVRWRTSRTSAGFAC